jgi:hypothetical protein
MSDWKPRPDSVAMLDYAMAQIKSVPYKVSSRWVFYRVLQAGLIPDKSFITKFDYLTSRARHSFYGDWRPDTLEDSVRNTFFNGELSVGYDVQLDSIEDQPYYVQLWYEARAMHRQFSYYTRPYRVSLVPFAGDVSIKIKWDLAKKLEQIYETYGKPIQILYFGDHDPKGYKILESALRDIRAWCKIPFSLERVGLTAEQARLFKIPEQPDKPGCFQWEALNDEQAKELILTSLDHYQDPVSEELLDQEKDIETKLHESFIEILNTALGREVFK